MTSRENVEIEIKNQNDYIDDNKIEEESDLNHKNV